MDKCYEERKEVNRTERGKDYYENPEGLSCFLVKRWGLCLHIPRTSVVEEITHVSVLDHGVNIFGSIAYFSAGKRPGLW